MERIPWRTWARTTKTYTHALYLASRDPRTPASAKLLAALAVAYALSPIDLIPDFIPVIGHLDDLLLLPLAFWLAVRLIPEEVWLQCRAAAEERHARLPRSPWAAAAIALAWFLVLAALALSTHLLLKKAPNP